MATFHGIQNGVMTTRRDDGWYEKIPRDGVLKSVPGGELFSGETGSCPVLFVPRIPVCGQRVIVSPTDGGYRIDEKEATP